MTISRTTRIARSGGAYVATALLLLGGCNFINDSAIRKLDEPYPQTYELPVPLNVAWEAVVRQAEKRPIQRVLAQDPAFTVVSWTENGQWLDCRPGSTSIDRSQTTVLWVIRLRATATGADLFARVTCYHLDQTSWEHEHSLGKLESRFVELVAREAER